MRTIDNAFTYPIYRERIWGRRRWDESIVGVWEVYAPGAPFPWHVMTFTRDGTVIQSNPHEGNRGESDSGGHGVWLAGRGRRASEILGKFVEFKADRETGKPRGKGVVVFACLVQGDSFTGTATAYNYGIDDQLMKDPAITPMCGTRVVIDDPAVRAARHD